MTRQEASSLSVVVECDAIVCAIPTSSVLRLLLDEEVEMVSASKDAERPARLKIGSETWLGFNLGSLLAIGETRGAWVLLALSLGGRSLPIALRTGRCLAVRELPSGVELPPHIFQARQRALRAAFSVAGLGIETRAVCGARLDAAGLLEGAPMRNAIAALESRRHVE